MVICTALIPTPPSITAGAPPPPPPPSLHPESMHAVSSLLCWRRSNDNSVVVIQHTQRCKSSAHAHCVATSSAEVCLQHFYLLAHDNWFLFNRDYIIITIIVITTFGCRRGIFSFFDISRLLCFESLLKIFLLDRKVSRYSILYGKTSLFVDCETWWTDVFWLFMSVLDILFANLLFDWNVNELLRDGTHPSLYTVWHHH